MARGSESYEFLRDCFAPVWMEVTDLIRNPVVAVEGEQYDLRVVCGSDYKVRIQGLKTSKLHGLISLVSPSDDGPQ